MRNAELELAEELEEDYLRSLESEDALELAPFWEQPPGTPACPEPSRETVSRFRRHSNSVGLLPGDEQDKIKAVVARIVRSFQPGCQPLLRVGIIGHADRDPAAERLQPGFELLISRQRALAVQREIVRMIDNPTISSRLAFDRRGVGASSLVVQNPANEREREMNRRVGIDLARSCSCAEFFQEYDRRSEPSEVDANPAMTPGEKRLRKLDVLAMVRELLMRRDKRAAAALQGNVPAPAPASRTLTPIARRLSAFQIELYQQCFPDRAGGIDLNTFQSCFEQFANGELAPPGLHEGKREPDSSAFFYFAEFAFLCIDSHIEEATWTRALRTFVKTQEIFIHVYRPAPPPPIPYPTPPPVDAPLPALGPALRSLEVFRPSNFNLAGQSDPARKSALRAKYNGMSVPQLRLAARDNLLRAQRMPEPSSPRDCLLECEQEARMRLGRPPTQAEFRRIRERCREECRGIPV